MTPLHTLAPKGEGFPIPAKSSMVISTGTRLTVDDHSRLTLPEAVTRQRDIRCDGGSGEVGTTRADVGIYGCHDSSRTRVVASPRSGKPSEGGHVVHVAVVAGTADS